MARGADHWSHRRPELVLRGEAHGRAVLTEAAVRAIRRRFGRVSVRALAREYRVSRSTIALVVKRERWRHVV
jgi:DNA invertase Pin-like site-specific DNA recombinase